jgi:hypothetical protein
METKDELKAIVNRVVARYATRSLNATLYHLHDEHIGTDAVIVVPQKRQNVPHVMIMTRIEDDQVVIETDRTDRPLEEALIAAGIPRSRITLAYAGEVPVGCANYIRGINTHHEAIHRLRGWTRV